MLERNTIMECEMEVAAQSTSGVENISAPISVLSAPPARVPVVAPPLRVSFSWTLAGSVVYSACNWAMISILAKLGTPSIVGQFALGLAISVPVFMLSNLQLRGIQATDSRSEFAFSDYFTLRMVATAMGLAAVLATALCTRMNLLTVTIICLVGTTKAIEALSDIVAGLLQKAERLDQLAIILAARGLLSLLAFGCAFWKFHSLVAALAATAVAWAAIFVLYELPLAARINGSALFLKFRWQVLKRLAVVSLPLGAVMALGSLNLNLPRYALERYAGTSQLGIFASLAYIGTSATVIVNALGQSASARLARMFTDRDFEGFSRLMRKFIVTAALIAIVGLPVAIVFGKRLLTALYQTEYANYLGVLLILIVTTSIGAIASFIGYGVTAARCFTSQLFAMAAVSAGTAMAVFFLVPRLGIVGAAWSLMAAALLQLMTLGLLLWTVIARAQSSGTVVRNGALALFSPSLAAGGAEKVLLNLAVGLQERGQRIDIVLAQRSGEYVRQIPEYANVIDLGATRTLTCLPALVRYIRRERPAGIIAFQDHANVIALWARAIAGLNTPVIPTVHNTWSRMLDTGTWKTRALGHVAGFAYRRTARVVAVSEGAADDLAKQFGMNRDSIVVIYNPVVGPQLFAKAAEPVEDEWFKQYHGPWVIGVGRLTKQKDFANLIEAFSHVRKEIDCRLLILGEGPDRPVLEQLIRRLRLEDDCFLPGFVDNPYKYLSRAKLFVLSSAWEGLPTVLIEALALGVPAISTDCESGPREILRHGALGVLVQPGNSRVLGAKIAECLLNPCQPSVGTIANNYSFSVAADRYVRLLEG